MLLAYYNILYKDKFEEIFKDTYILDNPTEEKSKYYCMKFDFSGVDITDYKNSFKNNLTTTLKKFAEQYKIDFTIDANKNPIDMLHELLSVCQSLKYPLYIFIDEYDNFVNKLFVSDIEDYKGLATDKEAFYKEFFTMLKVGTSDNDSPIRKMFITGVSPLALFDVTSGSNIGSNVSSSYRLNALVGVTKEELITMIEYYGLSEQKEHIINRCDEWYDSYRFNENVPYTIYNSDMILYYLKSLIYDKQEPKELIDVNVRAGYSKLKYLVYTNKRLNGNFELLNQLIQGEKVMILNLKDNFSAFEMTQESNFESLLFALGFVTMEKYGIALKLYIPNQTIKKIVADFIYSAFKDIAFNFKINTFNRKIFEFANSKNLELFTYLNEQVKAQSVVRDYIQGESFLKGFLVAYFSLNNLYEVYTEKELNKGFADITLNPISNEVPYGAIIELKYISRSNYTDAKRDELISQAKEQIEQYDPKIIQHFRDKPFAKIVLVYSGWEMVYCEEIEE